jgi:5-methylcytosine-specific restriction endonuclease McrA
VIASMAPTERECKGCAVKFITTDKRQWFHKKGCGRSKRELQTNDWLLANKPHFPTKPCLTCGKPVVQYRKRRRDGELRYCGAKCRPITSALDPIAKVRGNASWPPLQTSGAKTAIPRGCIDCGTGLRLGRCQAHANQMFSLRQQLRTRLVWLMPRTCTRCGQNWNGWGSIARLCVECRRAGLLAIRTARRAKVKLGDNTISLRRVWQRDNGRCHICKQRTDLPSVWQGWNYSNEWMPKAPTVDHILALANGGSHTWSNVALAHNECNSKKSDNLTREGDIYCAVTRGASIQRRVAYTRGQVRLGGIYVRTSTHAK